MSRQIDLEDLPKRKSISHHDYDWDRRGQGLFMPGLRAMIAKNVGRPWSKVYHEIIEKIERDFPQRDWDELRRSIWWFVDPSPMHVGNGIYIQHDGRQFYGHVHSFYVNPETGLLCRPKKSWDKILRGHVGDKNPWDQPVQYIDNRCYRRMSGIWYEVELVSITGWGRGSNQNYQEKDSLWQRNLFDVVLKMRVWSSNLGSLAKCHGYRTGEGKLISREEYRKHMDRRYEFMFTPYDVAACFPVYARSIRQLSKQEIKWLGLGNQLTAPNLVPKHRKKRR